MLAELACAGLFEATRSAALATALAASTLAPIVECELAIRLRADVDGRRNLTRADIIAAIESCCVACEIVVNRYGDALAVGAPTVIVDDSLSVGFVLGDPIAGSRDLDFAALQVRVSINGTVNPSRTEAALDPIEAVQWLAGNLIAVSSALKAGEVIMTGSILLPAALPAQAHELSLSINGLGSLGFATTG